MTTVPITLEQLAGYVHAAVDTDAEIVRYFDRHCAVSTAPEAADCIIQKIDQWYTFAECYGIEHEGEKIGYLVTCEDYLISFSIAPAYRNEHGLAYLWQAIVSRLGEAFTCTLYAYNHRAIGWLRKCGMEVGLQEVTILHFNKQT